MPQVVLLGTGAACTDPHRTTTMLAVLDGENSILIDCGGDVIQRAQQADIPLEGIDGIILTHEHPDHVSGFPLFIEKIWLCGRTRPIDMYGIAPALDQARRCFDAFSTENWALPELRWHTVAHEEDAPVIDNELWRITASPGVHSVPVVGLRFESKRTGASMAYSCDTEASPSIERMATGVDLLIHEANGPVRGHSSTEDAARIAAAAGASSLVLVHLPAGTHDSNLAAARSIFPTTRYGDELESVPFRS